MKLPGLSGEEVVKVLISKFGFRISRQRGDLVVLVKFIDSEKRVTVVPLHKELKPGTLLGVLKLARISREEFLEALKKK